VNTASVRREFKELPIGLIDDPENPSRTQMDEQLLDELTASIRAIGLQQPMIVFRAGERFQIIAGHRRRIACGRAGLVAAPCIIYPSKDDGHAAIQYAENRHREELNAADEAIWFHEMFEGPCAGDVDKLCERIGEKRSYVEGRLLLFRGDELVFERLREGKITIGVAQQLNKCTVEQYRRYLLHQAITGGATVAVVCGWIMYWKRQQQPASDAAAPPSADAAPPPIPENDFFRCACCGRTDHVHLMRQINVHDYCKRAILDPLLDTYRGVNPSDEQPADPRRI
jgi:ParB family chromosome partitioning protein